VNTAHTEDSLVTHLADWTDAGKTAWNKYKLLAGTTDENSDTDYNKMNTLGKTVANNDEGTPTAYWLASRLVFETWFDSSAVGSVNFEMWSIDDWGDKGNFNLWAIASIGRTSSDFPACAVRPVVKLQYP